MMELQYRPLTVVVPAETDEEWSPRLVGVSWSLNDQEWSPVVRCAELLARTRTTRGGFLSFLLSLCGNSINWVAHPGCMAVESWLLLQLSRADFCCYSWDVRVAFLRSAFL
jgi:hypothetical protein